MAAIVGGFTYRSGPYKVRYYTAASTATFRKGCPVAITSATDGNVVDASVGSFAAIVGIAISQGPAAVRSMTSVSSDLSNLVQVLVPEEDTVFELGTGGVAHSNFTAGTVFDIAKSGDYPIVLASTNTATIVVVPRDDGTMGDSTNSTVLCCILRTRLDAHGEIS